MPHQCTSCGRRFPDGSKEMLSGCPDCGGNKFQFRPGDGPDADADAGTGGPDAAGAPSGPPPGDAVAADADSADDDPLSRSWPAHDPDEDAADDADIIEPDPEPPAPGPEDDAQADARAEVAAPDELADPAHADAPSSSSADGPPSEPPVADATVASTPDGERPDLTELREELNDQFESIRVLNPGQYELNLMELYDREEYIISLREDGRYVIEVPETWRRSEPE
ncbi:MAG: Zn-ribbon domain-containing protein [Haloferacaceae archaeon]